MPCGEFSNCENSLTKGSEFELLFISRHIFQTMKSLQAGLNTVAADNMHAILSVCQQLRADSERDAESLNRMQNELDALLERSEQMTETIQYDKELIAQQRDQIGVYKLSTHFKSCHSTFHVSTLYPVTYRLGIQSITLRAELNRFHLFFMTHCSILILFIYLFGE